ncbi:MAG: hypothetical protein V4629_00195 [Pseudomonadota bacterium]
MDTLVTLDSDTESTIRAFYSRELNQQDMEFVADWFMMVGISTVQASMSQNPHMTIRDVMNLTFKVHNA